MTSTDRAGHGYPCVSMDEFKLGMRHLAAAVTVITVDSNGTQDGLTATAACSVSAEPPQLLICVNTLAGAHDLIATEGTFCVNVLNTEQEDIAKRFAGIDGAPRSERYGLGSWTTLTTGAPVLEDAMVSFDCEVVQQVLAGTHTVFIGHIVGLKAAQQGMPLMYGVGQFVGLDVGL